MARVSLIGRCRPQPRDELDPIALLDAAPEDEFALLELRIDWRY